MKKKCDTDICEMNENIWEKISSEIIESASLMKKAETVSEISSEISYELKKNTVSGVSFESSETSNCLPDGKENNKSNENNRSNKSEEIISYDLKINPSEMISAYISHKIADKQEKYDS